MPSSTISAVTVTRTTTTTTRLSSADASVLAALFDPESSLAAAEAATSKSTVIVQPVHHEEEKEEKQQEQESQVRAREKIQKALELVNCAAPPRPAIEEAISVLDSLIDEEINNTTADDGGDDATGAGRSVRGEAYINRAQARRLLLHIDNGGEISSSASSAPSQETARIDARMVASTTTTIGNDQLPSHGMDHQRRILSSVLDDLSAGIRILASLKPTTVTDLDRTNQALANAFTHRGFILHALSRDTSTNTSTTSTTSNNNDYDDTDPSNNNDDDDNAEEDSSSRPQISTSFTGYAQIRALGGKERTAAAEAAAAVDFAEGARRGNQLARKMSVALNPYAKLCGNIVREALQREMTLNTA